MRSDMRQETILDYADDMLHGAAFPPVTIYYDGTDHWLSDGFHRVAAAQKIDRETIDAEIREGTARDAILHGIGSNTTPGLRRTQADKRCAVARLLSDPEWAKWSDRKIARIARVDHKTVGKVRRELTGEIPGAKSMSGEIPNTSGKPIGKSLITDILRSVADDLLITECRRRGLTMEAADA